MSLLVELNAVKILRKTQVIDDKTAGIAFINVMSNHDGLFHFDEPAAEIIKWNGDNSRLFSDVEAELIDELVKELYDTADLMMLLVDKQKERGI